MVWPALPYNVTHAVDSTRYKAPDRSPAALAAETHSADISHDATTLTTTMTVTVVPSQ